MPTRLRQLLDSAPIVLDVDASSVNEAAKILVDALVESRALDTSHRDAVLSEILDREHEQSTALARASPSPTASSNSSTRRFSRSPDFGI